MIVSAKKPWLVFFLSAAALLILAFFSVGYYHPDEHFQILEFARWKLDPSRPEPLPWEFHNQMRPAIQPGMVYVMHKFFHLFGISDPFLIAFFLRTLSAGISFLAMWMIYRCYYREISSEKVQKWFLLISFLLWFELNNAVRFTSETWSGAFFIIGFSYLFLLKRIPGNVDFLVTGVLLGFSFVFRYQTGFLVFGYFLWFCVYGLMGRRYSAFFPGGRPVKKMKITQLAFLLSGIIAAMVIGMVIDDWFYGNWVLTAWNYFDQNLLAGKISGFGVQPWWFFFEDIFIRALPPFSLVFILGTLVVFIFLRNDLLTWTLFPFILVHFLISHKETRFLYPIIGFLPVIVIKATEFVNNKFSGKVLEKRSIRIFAATFWTVNCIFIFVNFFNPADIHVNLYRVVYHKYPYPVTLHYVMNDPYHRALAVSYYKRPDLRIRKIESVSDLDSITEKRYLVAIRKRDPGFEKLKNHRLIYSTYPDWIKYVNVNNWQERSQIWYLYENNQ